MATWPGNRLVLGAGFTDGQNKSLGLFIYTNICHCFVPLGWKEWNKRKKFSQRVFSDIWQSWFVVWQLPQFLYVIAFVGRSGFRRHTFWCLLWSLHIRRKTEQILRAKCNTNARDGAVECVFMTILDAVITPNDPWKVQNARSLSVSHSLACCLVYLS